MQCAMAFRVCLRALVCFSWLGWLQHSKAAEFEVWRRLELPLADIPAAANPFDPGQIQVDVEFRAPSGATITIPAFWSRDYSFRLANNQQVLDPVGAPGWRVRHVPVEPGRHQVVTSIKLNGQPFGEPRSSVVEVAGSANPSANGHVRLAPGGQFFEKSNGQPLPLVGANVCWHGGRGLADYQDWFPTLAANGANFARIWMSPWAFGIEAEPGTLNRYKLDRAWVLDQVFDLAERHGIQLLLCLDYHGMFETKPDFWGANDNWKLNPYNQANGGPCATPNNFFTNAEARALYLKRLRYLVARHASSPNLLAWEFFNEIDNVYGALNPASVADWHAGMVTALKAMDPFHHLVTTSLTGGSLRDEIWSLPGLDFTQYHSYGESSPATRMAEVVATMRSRYQKPVLIGEFGVDFRGWTPQSDPFNRGFRQYLWGSALGGSAGSGMSWWWQDLHKEGLYKFHRHFKDIISKVGWGSGVWKPISFAGAGAPPPTVGAALPHGAPFTTQFIPGSDWGGKPRGSLGLATPEIASFAPGLFNAFLHGSAHAALRTPFKVHAQFDQGARIVAHVNSVSTGARLGIYVDGVVVLSVNLPDKDGLYSAQVNEYNIDITADIPKGAHTVELRNLGSDWLFLDWVRLENILPAEPANGWAPSPAAVGQGRGATALAYLHSPFVAYPSNATAASPPSQIASALVLQDWPAGQFDVEWLNPSTGARLALDVASTEAGKLTLFPPPHDDDLAALVTPRVTLRALPPTSQVPGAAIELQGPSQHPMVLERSDDLRTWHPYLTNTTDTFGFLRSILPSDSPPSAFFRSRGM